MYARRDRIDGRGSRGPGVARGGAMRGSRGAMRGSRGAMRGSRGGHAWLAGGHAWLAGGHAWLAGGHAWLAGGPCVARGGPCVARGGPCVARGGPCVARGGHAWLAGGHAWLAGGHAWLAGGHAWLAGGHAWLAGGHAVAWPASDAVASLARLCFRKALPFGTRCARGCRHSPRPRCARGCDHCPTGRRVSVGPFLAGNGARQKQPRRGCHSPAQANGLGIGRPPKLRAPKGRDRGSARARRPRPNLSHGRLGLVALACVTVAHFGGGRG